MTKEQKILLTGVKPTGRPHIGNYFGAMKQVIDRQNDFETNLIFIADLHALTTTQNATELNQDALDIAIDYLALGLDPAKAVLFRQSSVPAHSELCWIFNCITTVPYLQRAHAYKDATTKNHEVSVGTFDYPLLMAADILLYDTDVVPVGQDQKQHVEIARDTAEKFNRLFGETFKMPEPLILDSVKTVPGIDGQKMSKSYGNTIPLFATDEEIKTQVMKIVTDSKTPEEPKDPAKCHIFALHELFASPEELATLRQRYEAGGIGYKESKEILIANMIKFIAPLRERRVEIAKDPAKVLEILKQGSEQARELAEKKIGEIKMKTGLACEIRISNQMGDEVIVTKK
ncbi:MAG: Tryptophan-tRNA ligase [Parcubacteria group bacterium GW2011_GWC1_43_11b]|uniref:Tryptophan--tRNA ligase n=1 Tax=Candidatus Vogelbacteria bacterium RIFOXYB1_FULL_42_16 TaxID=1802436 RepID=A0A1G2QF98_9BACT|nr:MAG: Tryptophan-tRNA ligase [Parcubacteria group bacterium GW2011_GWB1_42_9]KKS89746.1 MAG: Tryptophan-tRNA ligase [Parcubacteria group bacterium GW2011_GWC1_43_11b]KKT09656.1 MAG: Tryptophan-tRNA ligase [Parcubacteria group bacterium GW2011_GWA1_43_21]OHA59295.1 MAG: tryptophan--tRNA ligase [Candidatus Vogelbacteria bacterium RIFOXYB1_FULL_42_16]